VPPPVPEHLLEQADRLTTDGARPTDLRRAISNAYYALFHLGLTAAADMIAGVAQRATPQYRLVYRSVDHAQLRNVCSQVIPTNPQVALIPLDGFGPVAQFAGITLNLHELRNRADYDPSIELKLDEARISVSDARLAVNWFRQGSAEQQWAFLMMLLFKQR
jgi:uncharacterized protein (UPF0332 family)